MGGIIFSHQRCGSSNLLRYIRSACSINGGMEPLNFRQLKKKLPSFPHCSHDELKSHCEKILKYYPVVKHIYGQHLESNDRMIASLSEGCIIFLYRDNTMAAALSSLIARKSGKGFSAKINEGLGRIEMDEVSKLSNEMVRKRKSAIEACELSGKEVFTTSYEDIFSPKDEVRKEKGLEILALLERHGVKTKGDVAEAHREFLAPSEKTNSYDTYKHIENIKELSEEMSWLRYELGPECVAKT